MQPSRQASTQLTLTPWPLAVRLSVWSAVREAILRGWNSACRNAERTDRVVPYY